MARRQSRKLAAMIRLLPLVFLLASNVSIAAAPPLAPPDTIAERVKPCLACHTAEGRTGKNEYYPRLAGKPQGYLLNQLLNFRDGRRHNRAMNLLLQNLSDAYLAEIAGYFSTQPLHYSSMQSPTPTSMPAKPTLITQGDPTRKIPACIACHGKNLMGAAPNIPGLLGLPNDYVSAQMGAWKVATRRATAPDCMGEIARQLSEVEVHAVASWLAAQPLLANARPAAALTDELPQKCGSVPFTAATSAKP